MQFGRKLFQALGITLSTLAVTAGVGLAAGSSTAYFEADVCPGTGDRGAANIQIWVHTGAPAGPNDLLASGTTSPDGKLTLTFSWPSGATSADIKYRVGPGFPWQVWNVGVEQIPGRPDGVNLTDGGIQHTGCDEWVDESTSTVYLKF